MKKVLFALLACVCAIGVYAWDFPDNYESKTLTIKPKDMKFRSVVDIYTDEQMSGCVLHDSATGLIISSGYYDIHKTADGLFVGCFKISSSSSSVYKTSANITVGSPRPFSMRKITLKFYRLNTDNNFSCIQTSFNRKYSELDEKCNGKDLKQLEITFNLPQNMLMLYGMQDGTWNYTDDVAKGYGYAAMGIVITEISIEYVPYSSYPFIDVSTTLNNYKDSIANAQAIIKGKNILNNVYNSELVAYGKHYGDLKDGDVNEDGALNGADVVAVYNNIQNGGAQFFNGHRYVDLGLPSGTLWADCNLGASCPEGYGDFFAWSEKDESLFNGKFPFASDNYSPRVSSPVANTVLKDIYFPPKNHINYAASWNGWNTPTIAQAKELVDNCTHKSVTINGVCGLLVTSTINNNSIFFPFTGYIADDVHKSKNVCSTIMLRETTYSDYQSCIFVGVESLYINNGGYCYIGRTSRLVCNKSQLDQ